jgi:uncharacterized protein (TIGR02266 family)
VSRPGDRSAGSAPNLRRFRRRTVRLRVELDAGGIRRFEWATTLGAGGLFLETEETLRVGTRLKLKFRLPGGEATHEVEGCVAWAMAPREVAGCPAPSPGMGVEFTDPVAVAKLAHELERTPETRE